VTRVAREVGTEGRLGGQAVVPGVGGTWKDLTDNVNLLAANLSTQVRNIAEVTTAVARGDLSRKITVDVKGEILELKNTINTMVDQLNAFASEVTRVAREVGTEGKLGGQAVVPGVAGTWKDLTDTVNVMGANLTEQVRGIVRVVTAVANGDLKQNLTMASKGEVAALAETINNMTNTLATFADEVTTVAREVGVEGRLGGQANVPGATGTWKDLTGNVNLLAANLTTQVRAIAEVATAVTKGDLTRSIQVEARGEVAELKDNINTMIENLRQTTDRNTEQDWLKTNLARFTNMLQGQRDLATVGRMLLSELAPLVEAQNGVIYRVDQEALDAAPTLRLLAVYADDDVSGHPEQLRMGQGLIGQCAVDGRRLLITSLPRDAVPISSGLFKATPNNVVVLPVWYESQVKAVIELGSVGSFTDLQLSFLEQLTAGIGIVLNSIEATMQTEGLLKQSQQLAAELQTRQLELQQTNEQLEQKAQQLAEQNVEVERKNQEIEQARRALEEQATELALTSKYKSEFLANMSHELRTPLNSILILGQQLADNPDRNLSARQVEFARTIHGAGTDLLNLISDILDLSKIESGTMSVDAEEILLANLQETVTRPFRHEAESRGLSFIVQVDPALRGITTDNKRLQQVLKNLLSNAFKFTEHGGVQLGINAVTGGWAPGHPILDHAPTVVAFEVSDTGIGIQAEKQRIIFEAFQQADASTSRKYGGTGLGLAISRELSNLLGGEIQLRSKPGVGSTFTLYLPLTYIGPATGGRGVIADAALRTDATLPTPVRLAVERPLEALADDRHTIESGDTVLLIVEDDPHYARVLVDLAHDHGLKVLVAMRGADALGLAREYQPNAVSLDVFLPDMLGWTVLSQLKQNPATRHIPVQIVTLDEDRQHGLARGAFSFMTKPATTEGLQEALGKITEYVKPRRKKLLVVEDNPAERLSITELLGHDDIDIVTVETGALAIDTLRKMPADCVVLDLRLPDMSGFEVLERIRDDEDLANVPVVVFTGRELSPEEDAQLHTMARSVVVKGVESPERLLDETALFLHRVVSDLPAEKQRMLEKLHSSDESLVGRKVLLVDDDARNIFALSSVLERRGMEVLTATTGSEAIETLEATVDVAIVLMDIMMPEMDGYQTMEVIRANSAFRRLPIIALTAKAMKGDREKCLEAGASDYLAKPVNTEQLLSALRIWLHR
jgi:CheY-like chemotaxis protein/HAMP domain-containing protein